MASALMHPRRFLDAARLVHQSRGRPVRELLDRTGDKPPDSGAIVIALLRKLFRPYSTFYVSLVAVALEHQVSDAPDIDLGDHAGRLSAERLGTVNTASIRNSQNGSALAVNRYWAWIWSLTPSASLPRGRSWWLIALGRRW